MNKIPFNRHNFHQAGLHVTAGGHHRFPIEICKLLLDEGDQGLLCVMRGPNTVPLSCAKHKNIQRMDIWGACGANCQNF